MVSEANGDAISEVTEVAGLSTVTIVGLKMRRDEVAGALSALQIDSTQENQIYSYNYISHTLPANYSPSNLCMYYNTQELPRNYPGKTN